MFKQDKAKIDILQTKILIGVLMLFTPTGTFYSKVQFKTEEEVEKVVARNFKLLFGDYSILLPKSLIRISGVVRENAVMNRETKNKIMELSDVFWNDRLVQNFKTTAANSPYIEVYWTAQESMKDDALFTKN